VIKKQSIAGIISSEEDENVSRIPQEKDWRQYWTADLLNIYSEKEQLLLNVFLNINRMTGYKPTFLFMGSIAAFSCGSQARSY